MDQETFRSELENALSHLRDVVRLRTTRLAAALFPSVPRGQRGWELSRYLLEAIQRLRPPPEEHDIWPRRRYDVLALRYVSGLSPDQVAERLAISSRHFYRQQQRALDELAGLLWAEAADRAHDGEPDEPALEHGSARLDLLRRELAPLLQTRQSCSLAQVWQSVFTLLSSLPPARSLSWQVDLPEGLPNVALSAEILKQLLLGLLGDLLHGLPVSTISLTAQIADGALDLLVSAQRDSGAVGDAERSAETNPWERAGERVSELATLHGASLAVAEVASGGASYRVTLPTVGTRTVLIVEDNEEVRFLFQRSLKSGGFEPLVAANGAEAIALARSRQLYAITLDLVMKDADGWDVLQALRDDPRTADVPIIVCSVLEQQELATMLGARAFLKKPVMREHLLQALAEVSSD